MSGRLSSKRWLHPDERGSIVAWTDAVAAATIYKYGTYGEPVSGDFSGSRFRYTGQIALPEVKLYHYKARVYDPYLGRFLQTDPVGYQQDFNLYAYAANDPLMRVDPLGLESVKRGLTLTLPQIKEQATTIVGSMTPPTEGEGSFKSQKDVDEAQKKMAAQPVAAVGNVESTPEQRKFFGAINRIFANVKISGKDQRYEIGVTFGVGPTGEMVVTSIEVLGLQGGILEVAPGEAQAHWHRWTEVIQPPNSGDHNSADRGIVSFVGSATGSKGWEVGRQDKAPVQRSIKEDGTPGKWRPFGSQQ